MKRLAFLGMCLALTGCSGTPSLSDSTKLIEYEKCLSAQETEFLIAGQRASDEKLSNFFAEQGKEGLLVKEFIKACKEFRP